MRTKSIRWLAVLIWMIVIFAFSHQAYSGRETEKYLGDANVPVRKAGHISEYMILYGLLLWALQKNDGRPRNQFSTKTDDGDSSYDTTGGEQSKPNRLLSLISTPEIAAFLLSLAYAASDEWHQSYVPGRSASLTDVTWDTSGVTLGMIILLVVRKKRLSGS